MNSVTQRKNESGKGLRRPIKIVLLVLAALVGSLFFLVLALVWLFSYSPSAVEPVAVYTSGEGLPPLPTDRPVKVLSWNVQYMAGKDYVFFYDLLDGSGPDTRPSPQAVERTLQEVARIVLDEDPDILLLQELDDGAARTGKGDQVQQLLALLPRSYSAHASAFYWKAPFVPHPKILGSVGMKLTIISKYRISRATRHQLPLMPDNFIVRPFNFKRAVLEVGIERSDGTELVVMSTHLDAFAQGTDTMEKQVAAVGALLDGLTAQGKPWIIGGDFNLLAPGPSYSRLPPKEQQYFNPQTEIAPLFDSFASVPSIDDINGADFARWFTQFPNGVRAVGPDRTIDYLFYSPLLKVAESQVRNHDTLYISDHLPVVATFLPSAP